jgi:hypothetical protein
VVHHPSTNNITDNSTIPNSNPSHLRVAPPPLSPAAAPPQSPSSFTFDDHHHNHDHPQATCWQSLISLLTNNNRSHSLPTSLTSSPRPLTSPLSLTNRFRRLVVAAKSRRRRYMSALHHYNHNDIIVIKHDHVLATMINGSVNTIIRLATLVIAIAARYFDIKLLSYIFLMVIW